MGRSRSICLVRRASLHPCYTTIWNTTTGRVRRPDTTTDDCNLCAGNCTYAMSSCPQMTLRPSRSTSRHPIAVGGHGAWAASPSQRRRPKRGPRPPRGSSALDRSRTNELNAVSSSGVLGDQADQLVQRIEFGGGSMRGRSGRFRIEKNTASAAIRLGVSNPTRLPVFRAILSATRFHFLAVTGRLGVRLLEFCRTRAFWLETVAG